MECPKCGCKRIRVTRTHKGFKNVIVRERKCLFCETKFITREVAIAESFDNRNNNQEATDNFVKSREHRGSW